MGTLRKKWAIGLVVLLMLLVLTYFDDQMNLGFWDAFFTRGVFQLITAFVAFGGLWAVQTRFDNRQEAQHRFDLKMDRQQVYREKVESLLELLGKVSITYTEVHDRLKGQSWITEGEARKAEGDFNDSVRKTNNDFDRALALIVMYFPDSKPAFLDAKSWFPSPIEVYQGGTVQEYCDGIEREIAETFRKWIKYDSAVKTLRDDILERYAEQLNLKS